MKNLLLKISAVIFLILAGMNPIQAAAQSKTDVYTPKKDDYTFEKGHILNKEYVDRILTKKMKQLQDDLSVLIEKKEPDYMKTIDKAMLLFNNDETKLITVTSKTTGKVTIKPVRDYLTDVSRLPYKSIRITYRNYTAIDNIRQQPDGTFKGVAVFQQEFTGFDKEGKAMYNDVIERNVEVTIRIKEYYKDPAYHIISTDIFFGNMGVTEM
ncbi:MAG: hypothetical protein ACHQD8_04925 [Chitinophagales bacterium]